MRRFVLLLLLFTLAPRNVHSQSAARVRVGVIAPLSGHVADVGETVKNSVILADKIFDKHDKVEFIFEDDGFLPKNSATAAKKLISQDMASGIIVFGSSTSLAVVPITESAKTPTITMALAESITVGRRHVYRLFMDTKSLARLTADEIARRNYQSIATVTTMQDGMLTLSKLVLESSKVPALLNEEVIPGETDLRTIATKVARLNPTGVLLALLPPQLAAFSQQLRQVGYKGDMFSGPQAQISNEVKASNGALFETWFATQDDRKAEDFYQNYRKEFNNTSPMPDGIFAYEAARLFIQGVEQGNIFEYLSKLQSFDGIHGTYQRMEPNIFFPPVAIKTITSEGFDVLLPAIENSTVP